VLQRARKPQLGRYEVLFRLAGGGMAEVFVGRLLGEGGFVRYVAIKRMLPHLAEDARFVDMFLDEGRLAGFVSSPNVVQTLDVGRDADGALFIVMELVRGASLHALLSANAKRGTHVPIPIALSLLVDAARGLHDAHEATTPLGEPMHLVHRDVSPQNLLVGIDGRARITDFGVARAVHRNTATAVGELKGKLGYFAPEQARGQVDRRTDVFALGIVAWELLTGRRLFDGDDVLQKLEKVRSMPIPAPSSRRHDVPPQLDAVIACALDRDLRTRCSSAGELAERLRDAARAAHVEPASPREVGAYVREVLGDAVANLERRLADAAHEDARARTHVGTQVIGETDPGTERVLTDEPPTLASEWVTVEASHTRTTRATPSEPLPSTPTPSTPTPSTPAPSEPRPSEPRPSAHGRSRRPWLVAAVLSVGGAVGAILAWGGDEPAAHELAAPGSSSDGSSTTGTSTGAVPVDSTPPTATPATPTPTDTTPMEPSGGARARTATRPARSGARASGDGSGAPSVDTNETRARSTATRAEGTQVQTAQTAPTAHEGPTAATSSPTPPSTPTTRATTPTTSPPRTTAATSEVPATMESTTEPARASGRLVGVDAFDRGVR
jgi:serine/threonine-protein kinase